ncbi:hypothetical protein TWF569_009203 [Orbilia oligospora]|uniref:Lysine-specific metallo-endopeptidase domain-containing protein n=1 Tax=Orbilia oligospora TaxID=2813651 RepID=A0A7C8N9S5_ORBOL|nr:hypothetical protein TWF103_004030 [Orbilia oligospora]KAF3085119.1 hypothetical protein TWF706_000563 [Orbilia oligospora]KAF3085683.1 hypothetical protein TWF102_011312 [Orbilia oligospora]KAF3127160.1 hypothetical protein TWF594_000755 [Orbilia oligospora]KAF3137505.1 hypothetical protein TWF569_009203 [Orbilia oligospora]
MPSFSIPLLLYFALSFTIPTKAGDRYVVEGTDLVYYDCPEDYQKVEINQAWLGAIRMAKYAKDKIDWNNGRAEQDFLGSPELNLQYREGIQDAITQLSSWDNINSGWWGSYKLQVTCKDWDKKCNRRRGVVSAYTSQKCPDIDAHCITFCPAFFRRSGQTNSLDYVVGEGIARDRYDDRKWDLRWYHNNQASTFLHEMFHIDDIVKTGSKLKLHVADIPIEWWAERSDQVDEDGKPMRILKEEDAYGPFLTKLLALFTNKDVDSGTFFVRQNADSYTNFILAKYITDKLQGYPGLPLARRDQISDAWIPWEYQPPRLVVKDEATWNKYIESPRVPDGSTESCDDQSYCENSSEDLVARTLNPIAMNDTKYSQDYLDTIKALAEQFPGPPKPVVITPEPSATQSEPGLTCYKPGYEGPYDSAYVPLSFAEPKIRESCALFKGIPLDAQNQQSLIMIWPIDGTKYNSLYTWVKWQTADPTCKDEPAYMMTEDDCVQKFLSVINSCDTDTVESKHGGARVTDCLAWKVHVKGDGGYNPSTGKGVECSKRVEDLDRCDCTDGIIRNVDTNGNCPGPLDPGFKKTRRNPIKSLPTTRKLEN